MTVKIKNIEISGIRGVRGSVTLPLDKKSILLYGDNGSGKSSISDSIEWFFTDSVIHLGGSEIDLKEALRNAFVDKNDESSVGISFSSQKFDNNKKLLFKRDKLITEFATDNTEFDDYLSQTNEENIILRYQHLTDFISSTKGEKLKHLSDIIGFAEVTKTKEVLQKSFNSIKSEIRNQNFETQINAQKQTLISKIGASVGQESDLFEKLNEVLLPFNLEKIKGIEDIDIALEKLNKLADSKIVVELKFLEAAKNAIATLREEVKTIEDAYSLYYAEHTEIAENIENILLQLMKQLLSAGSEIFNKGYKETACPLCLKPSEVETLQAEVSRRLKEIEESLKKKDSYQLKKRGLISFVEERVSRLRKVKSEPLYAEESSKDIRDVIESLESRLLEYLDSGKEVVTSSNKIPKPVDLLFAESPFVIIESITKRIEDIQGSYAKNNPTVTYANISAAKDAFSKIKKLEKDRGRLEKQQRCLELIFVKFVEKQKEGLNNFIKIFSGKINEFYQFMNPGELFQEINIVSLGDGNELDGITIEYKFKDILSSPPQKYFSESHLNCFGISFFLASVLAFNKNNKFIVLDDVISSFDTNHRKRFASLLIEKFSDYQIILLTHEEEWFNYIRMLVKNSWLINEVKWNDDQGTHLDSKASDLREIIENCLSSSDVATLGNSMRKYLESYLKNLCVRLDVKVSFRLNDINEKRMPDELINAIKSRISECSPELKEKLSIIERVAGSAQLANLLSHDNPFNPKLGDLKACWDDTLVMEELFRCQDSDCNNPDVSLKHYDTVDKKIRCGCGKTKYGWKK